MRRECWNIKGDMNIAICLMPQYPRNKKIFSPTWKSKELKRTFWQIHFSSVDAAWKNYITTMITWRCKRALVMVYKARQKTIKSELIVKYNLKYHHELHQIHHRCYHCLFISQPIWSRQQAKNLSIPNLPKPNMQQMLKNDQSWKWKRN